MTLRLAFQNVGGFLKDKEMAFKLEILHWMVIEREIDIFGFTEAGTYSWRNNVLQSTHEDGGKRANGA